MTLRVTLPRFDAAGNVYAVVAAHRAHEHPDETWARLSCRGGAADGVLIDVPAEANVTARVRILNPDGSRAETSGNGMRIFAYWLWREGRIAAGEACTIDTGARRVACRVAPNGRSVQVAMGTVRVDAARDVDVHDGVAPPLRVTPVDVGNPHAVVVTDEPVDEATVRHLGPRIETHPAFPNRTNVQFAWRDPLDTGIVHARVWERGAGWTASSGSSACAVSAAFRARDGHATSVARYALAVTMPGGTLHCTLEDGEAHLEGPVRDAP